MGNDAQRRFIVTLSRYAVARITSGLVSRATYIIAIITKKTSFSLVRFSFRYVIEEGDEAGDVPVGK